MSSLDEVASLLQESRRRTEEHRRALAEEARTYRSLMRRLVREAGSVRNAAEVQGMNRVSIYRVINAGQ